MKAGQQQGIRVAIVHRSRLLREGLALVLEQAAGAVIVGRAAQASLLSESVNEAQVLLVDFGLPGREGLEEARLLRARHPQAKVLMLGLTELEGDFIAAVESGANGCLREDGSLEDLVDQVVALARGECLFSARDVAALLSKVAGDAREVRRQRLVRLTAREREIVRLIEDGLTNREIAARLGIAIQTVKNHVHNVLEKLKLDRRQQIARFARENGLLQSPDARCA